MPGSTPDRLFPDGGPIRFRPLGSATPGALAAERTPASEPPIEPPLLRDFGRGLAAAGVSCPAADRIDPDVVETILAQLSPIATRDALLSSFGREANPFDERVRSAYARAWMRLPLSAARRRTRRARNAASMPVSRRSR